MIGLFEAAAKESNDIELLCNEEILTFLNEGIPEPYQFDFREFRSTLQKDRNFVLHLIFNTSNFMVKANFDFLVDFNNQTNGFTTTLYITTIVGTQKTFQTTYSYPIGDEYDIPTMIHPIRNFYLETINNYTNQEAQESDYDNMLDTVVELNEP